MNDATAVDAAPRAEVEPRAEVALPLFYAQPVPLNSGVHGAMRLLRDEDFGFAATAHAIPLVAAEIPAAIRSYPVVFVGDRPMPVAITGIAAGKNLFVEDGGEWLAPHYVPAYVRRYPFILAGDDGAGEYTLCFDAASGRVVADADRGEALFEDGKPSEMTAGILKFCDEYRTLHAATAGLMEAIADKGLLVERKGEIRLQDGGLFRLTDFRVVDEERLNALSDEDFLALRKSGALGLIYCHLASLNSWPELIRLAHEGR